MELSCKYLNVIQEIFPNSSAGKYSYKLVIRQSIKYLVYVHFSENFNCASVLSYSWVNMGCANCMMSHTSAVNGNVSHCWDALDNLNCI